MCLNLGCSGSSDVTSAIPSTEHNVDTTTVREYTPGTDLGRDPEGTDDYESVGREHTTLVDGNQHRHLESAPRARSMAAHSPTSILSPWLHVLLFYWNNIVFRWFLSGQYMILKLYCLAKCRWMTSICLNFQTENIAIWRYICTWTTEFKKTHVLLYLFCHQTFGCHRKFPTGICGDNRMTDSMRLVLAK